MMVSALLERELSSSFPIRDGVFVAVVGPSGAGKDTLIDYARARFADESRLEFVRRVITRPSDVASEDHDTLADAAFVEAQADGAFAVSWEAHGLRYGLPVDVDWSVASGHVAVAGVGIPLPINWHLPGAPGWGAEAKKVDRENFNHSLAVAMVLHDMPRHDNRVDLDDEVVDAWGLPVARVTLEAHENDLAQGRYLIDRGADILEASGARSVNKVYAQRVTGNCSHQHGTARMGDDPGLSVLNRWCRAHEVENLYAVDGSPFPTGTGANLTLTIMANAWRVADRIIATRGAAA